MIEKITTDVLVVGSGIAGLLAARLLHDKGCSALVASASPFGGGASFFPLKGTLGLQVTGGESDHAAFAEDLLRVGGGLMDETKMQAYIRESSGKEELLRLIGFEPRLRADTRPACFARYSRPIFLIGQWEETRRRAREIFRQKGIPVLEKAQAVKLFKEGERISGALLASPQGLKAVQAKAVVLAGGGISGLYEHKLYPADVDGSCWGLAAEAGASLINCEFIQFIPAFIKPKYNLLFGEHTLKYLKGAYDSHGKDLFPDLTSAQKEELFFERSAYAPFSVDFPSCIFDIRMEQAGEVHLDYRPELYQDEEAFYKIYLQWLRAEQGVDLLAHEPAVRPFAHASNGGIEISSHGESSVPGLYALGEAACGVEGANRMGGNSVGGIVVFAPRLAEKAASYVHSAASCAPLPLEGCGEQAALGASVPLRKKLAALMQKYAGIIRTQRGLEALKGEIQKLRQDADILFSGEKPLSFWASLNAAEVLADMMLTRPKSIGAHYREDDQQITSYLGG